MQGFFEWWWGLTPDQGLNICVLPIRRTSSDCRRVPVLLKMTFRYCRALLSAMLSACAASLTLVRRQHP